MQQGLGVDGEGQPLDERRYLARMHQVFGEWWKNQVLHQHDVDVANETYLSDYLIFF